MLYALWTATLKPTGKTIKLILICYTNLLSISVEQVVENVKFAVSLHSHRTVAMVTKTYFYTYNLCMQILSICYLLGKQSLRTYGFIIVTWSANNGNPSSAKRWWSSPVTQGSIVVPLLTLNEIECAGRRSAQLYMFLIAIVVKLSIG